MTKKLLIDASHAEETRVVVLDGNRLEDFDVEVASRKQIKGNIYLAKVIRVEPSLQAAFVEYGGNRHGFLAFGEIHPDYYQIPVADRERLLALQAEDAAHEAEQAEQETAPVPEAEPLSEAQPLEIRPIEILAAPPPEEGSEAAPTEAAQTEAEYVQAGEGDEAAPQAWQAESAEPIEQEPEQAMAPPPEHIGGDGDDAAEARERRQRQRFLRNYKIQDVIHRRQIMLIQVVKEERGNKGAALTTYLSLAGRFSVLMPNSPSGGGVSRKITSLADRRRLKEAMAELDVPEGMGLIVRTAGANRPKPEITRDCEYLLRLWDDIRDRTLESTAPALIYEEANLIKRTIRDVYTRDVEEVLVDGEEGFHAARDFMRMLMPSHARKVQLWTEGQPLFSRHQVEAQLDAMLSPIVQLRSGGYIVINQTEALVAIDVNSGRSTRERSIEDTALRTNLEAAEEVAKQLRIRDLAGLIVVDFIDMESRRNNVAVERKLKDALKNDRARIQMGTISHFGLMEMSRQRLRPSLTEASLIVCPHCAGMGHVRSPESAALHILRAIEDEGAKFRAAEIAVTLHPDIAFYLFNHKRERLSAIEARYAMQVIFTPDAAMTGTNFRIEKLKAQTATAPQPPKPVTQAMPEPVDEVEEEEQETADASDAGESANEAKRRRRRRRGKRRPEGAPDAVAPAADMDGGASPVIADDQPSEFDLILAAELGGAGEETPPVPEEEQPAPRRRRTRAPRRKTTKQEDAAPAEAEATDAPATAEPVFRDVADIFEAAERAEAELRRTRKLASEVLEAAGELTVTEPAPEPTPEPVAEAEPVAEPETPPAEPVVKPIVIGADVPVVEKKRGWWRR